MDSQVQADGRQQEIVDDEWRKDKLPEDDIAVPFGELPDPEADNGAGGSTGPGCSGGESLREQENKWKIISRNGYKNPNILSLHKLLKCIILQNLI